MIKQPLTYEYIRGLVEGEGTFTFSSIGPYDQKKRVPAFALKMHIRDKALLEAVRDFLELNNKIYVYHYPGKDGFNRSPFSMLIVREFGSLKNIIIPLFYQKLRGNKAIQFENWLERIGADPLVTDSFKTLHRLHKVGYFERELSPSGLFMKFLD